MAGISDKALKTQYAENKYRFQKQELQNKEFSDGSGLEMYEFKYRFDDPQIGRFWSIDPLADQYVYNSPYAFSEDKVTSHVELEGLEATPINDFWGAVKGALQGAADRIDRMFTYTTSTTASTENNSSTVGPVTTTNSTNVTASTATTTNLGGNINYIMNHNTNQGSTEPATKTDATVKVSNEQKTDIKTGNVTLTTKTSVDNNGVVTVSAGAKTNINIKGVQVTVGSSGSQSSDGKTSVTASGSTVGDPKGKVNVTYSTNGNSRSVEFSAGGEKKVGKTTITTTAGVKVNF